MKISQSNTLNDNLITQLEELGGCVHVYVSRALDKIDENSNSTLEMGSTPANYQILNFSQLFSIAYHARFAIMVGIIHTIY